MTSKKLVFVVNEPAFFLSHRLPVALGALKSGYDVHIITADRNTGQEITKHGFKHHRLPLSRRGKNPFMEILTLVSLIRLFRSIRPDIVHLVTIKPVLYGCIAARITRVPAIVAAVSGLGSTFIAEGIFADLTSKLIKQMYRVAFNYENIKVIFQNSSDRDLLVSFGALTLDKAVLVRGSGVDLKNYSVRAEPESTPVVSLASRLLKDKGIYEFVEAARILKGRNRDIRFQLIGSTDPGNPSSITEKEVLKWKGSGFVEIMGYRNDIAEIFSNSNLIVLPSYREGLPKVLVEAAACGRAIVTTDVPGCRDAIIPDETGWLVPVRNSQVLADRIESILDNHELRKRMGAAGRVLAEREFHIDSIVDSHMRLYNQFNIRKKKVVIVTTSLLIVKFFLVPILEELAKYYEITLLVNIDDEEFLHNMKLPVKVEHLPIERKFSLLNDLKTLTVLTYYFFKTKPDIVHTIGPKSGFVGILAGWFAGVEKRLHTFQGEVWTTKTGVWKFILKTIDRVVGALTTNILVVSKSERSFLIENRIITEEKSKVLANGSICGVNLKRFEFKPSVQQATREELAIGKNCCVYLYLGRLNKDKGVPDLIAAFSLLKSSSEKEMALLIVGPDEENIIGTAVIPDNIKSSIRIIEYTDSPQKFITSADVLILPSYREGFGLVIIEAAAAKVPAIGSRVYGITDAIEEGKTGLLFESGNISDLAAKMKVFAENGELRKQMGEAAFQRCEKDFSQSKVIQATVDYYNEYLSN